MGHMGLALGFYSVQSSSLFLDPKNEQVWVQGQAHSKELRAERIMCMVSVMFVYVV